ncbi:alpha/beta fold hydrolase [Fructilactobacillus ixorae]|uniref:Alpha/beta fold hydrolase n=1 Tax=Fructilactobacillus ixorae TaxID=1750535 RepID=A0ABY5C7E0_9LACO|nr:alpha/beta fold hydrolase [Fructilactobacillus ixorae]USS93226.1 alpha/beta fold hydrolase [Fructilactobacillus ixorae]
MQRFFTYAGYSYQIDVQGAGSPTWVFLHGFLGTGQDFAPIRPRGTSYFLTLYGFRPTDPVVPAPGFTVDQQVEALQTLVAQLSREPVHLVGYSMGARLALCLALTAPELVHHLILESGTAGIQAPTARRQRQQADAHQAALIEHQGLASFVTNWERLPLFQSQQAVSKSQQRHMHQMRCVHQPVNMANSLRYFGTGTMPNYWPHLSQLQPETTIITGELDQKFTRLGRDLTNTIPRATQLVYPATGHNVHFERPCAYTQALNQLEKGDSE